jgi:putative chitinase
MPTDNEIHMLRAARASGVTSREEMANFMAQMGHESGGFNRLEEGFRYTQGIQQIPVSSALREGVPALEAARVEALRGQPQELARLMYGGRMGNDDAGDGYLYRGRGYTQLTGEENYRSAGGGVGMDLVGQPDLAANRDNAERIALWYWENRVPAADRDDVTRATQGINGGTNGLADRLNRYDAWHAVLTPEFVAELDAGRVRPGVGIGPAVGRPAMEDGALRRLEAGEEVRQLNDNLRALNIRADRGREVPAGPTYTGQTEEAVRRFQGQQQLPETGRADPATLQAIQRGIDQQRRQPTRQDRAQLSGQQEPPTLSGQAQQLLADSRDHVQRVVQAKGLAWDQGMENTVYALAQTAGEAGMTRITHLKVDAGQIRLAASDGWGVKETRLDAQQAANTPVNASEQKLAGLQPASQTEVAVFRGEPEMIRG